MTISWAKGMWFVASLIISGYLSFVAFNDPLKFVQFTDLLATIISILIGLSLAISAILSTRPTISNFRYGNEEERKRLEEILKKDDLKLQDGQFLLFWFYYGSLISAVVLKFMGIQVTDEANIYLKVTSAGFVFIASLSLLWSATLPSLLKSISSQRQELE
jgi:hypothetical protein